jgi:hypothetical protein
MKQDNQKLLINGAIIVVAYFGIIRPILTKLGIQKTDSDRLVDRQENLPNNQNAFSPTFYKTGGSGTLLLTMAVKQNLAKRIYDALGVFSDDESAIFSVFRQLKSQSQVSYLAEYFGQKYKSDLLDYLKRGYSSFNPASGLSAEELQIVLNIVNNLPKYR